MQSLSGIGHDSRKSSDSSLTEGTTLFTLTKISRLIYDDLTLQRKLGIQVLRPTSLSSSYV
jgi:hypothetical protein